MSRMINPTSETMNRENPTIGAESEGNTANPAAEGTSFPSGNDDSHILFNLTTLITESQVKNKIEDEGVEGVDECTSTEPEQYEEKNGRFQAVSDCETKIPQLSQQELMAISLPLAQEPMALQETSVKEGREEEEAAKKDPVIPQPLEKQEPVVPQSLPEKEQKATEMPPEKEQSIPQSVPENEQKIPQLPPEMEPSVPQPPSEEEQKVPRLPLEKEPSVPQSLSEMEPSIPQTLTEKEPLVPQSLPDNEQIPQLPLEMEPSVPQSLMEKEPSVPLPLPQTEQKVPQSPLEMEPSIPQSLMEKEPSVPLPLPQTEQKVPQSPLEMEPSIPQSLMEKEPSVPLPLPQTEQKVPQSPLEMELSVPQSLMEKESSVPQSLLDNEQKVPQLPLEMEPSVPQSQMEKEPSVPPSLPQTEQMVPQLPLEMEAPFSQPLLEKESPVPCRQVLKEPPVSQIPPMQEPITSQPPGIKELPLLQSLSEKAWPWREDTSTSALDSPKPKPAAFEGKGVSLNDTVEDLTSQLKQVGNASKSAMANSISSFVDSQVGQVFAHTIDRALEKSEEWLDYYLPELETDVESSTAAEEEYGAASEDLCKEGCFMRINCLSTKMRNRAFKLALHQLKTARQAAKVNLSVLDQLLDVLEHTRSPNFFNIASIPESLQNFWAQWASKLEAPKSAKTLGASIKETPSIVPQQLELKALDLTRTLAQQLYGTYHSLLPHVADLPSHLQEKAIHVYENMEELQSHFVASPSLQNVPSSLIIQSRQKMAVARENLDEILDFMAQNPAANWLSQSNSSTKGKQPKSAGVERQPKGRSPQGKAREESSTSRRPPSPSHLSQSRDVTPESQIDTVTPRKLQP